jgi:hypothetical protein
VEASWTKALDYQKEDHRLWAKPQDQKTQSTHRTGKKPPLWTSHGIIIVKWLGFGRRAFTIFARQRDPAGCLESKWLGYGRRAFTIRKITRSHRMLRIYSWLGFGHRKFTIYCHDWASATEHLQSSNAIPQELARVLSVREIYKPEVRVRARAVHPGQGYSPCNATNALGAL